MFSLWVISYLMMSQKSYKCKVTVGQLYRLLFNAVKDFKTVPIN